MKKVLVSISVALSLSIAGYAAVTSLPSPDKTQTTINHHVQLEKSQPYAGYQERTIKALSGEEIDNLAKGKGAGYALAGELNHYPGPKHVMDFSVELKLSESQMENLNKQNPLMEEEAKAIGAEILQLEEKLDQEFKKGTITDQKLEELTSRISNLEGRLRYTHLKYHLLTKNMMTDEQISKYDELRGYK